MRVPAPSVSLLFAAALAAMPLAAQPPSDGPSDGWALSVGPRLLVDFESSNLTLGGEARFAPAVPSFLQLRAIYDFTFLDGLTERTFLLDVLYATQGFAVGGGPVVRNTRIGVDDPRENFEGWSAVVMLGGDPRSDGRFNVGIELRWIFLDPFDPRTLGAVVSLPLL